MDREWVTPNARVCLKPLNGNLFLGRSAPPLGSVVNKLMRVLVTDEAVILQSGKASGNLGLTHIIVSRNWFPALVQGSGPTQSTNTQSKGSPIAE